MLFWYIPFKEIMKLFFYKSNILTWKQPNLWTLKLEVGKVCEGDPAGSSPSVSPSLQATILQDMAGLLWAAYRLLGRGHEHGASWYTCFSISFRASISHWAESKSIHYDFWLAFHYLYINVWCGVRLEIHKWPFENLKNSFFGGSYTVMFLISRWLV